MKRRFIQCDVFTDTPYKGNPLAVVVDGEGLSDQQMQQFANWTNLSETTFLLKPVNPKADYKVRIYTPQIEMPFAGHPTLGSCAAWLDAGGIPATPGKVVQECQIGLIDIDISNSPPAFTAPATRIEQLSDEEIKHLAGVIDLPAEKIVSAVFLENGPPWLVLELESASAVLGIDADKISGQAVVSTGGRGVSCLGVLGAHTNNESRGDQADFEVRLFASEAGIVEDPITGSLNAAIAMWLDSEARLAEKTLVSQGTALGREGRLFIRRLGPSDIQIGGHSHIQIRGDVEI